MKQYSEDSYICTAGKKRISLSEFINVLHGAMQYLDHDMVGNFRGLIDILETAIRHNTDTETSNIIYKEKDEFETIIFDLRPYYNDNISRRIIFSFDRLKDQPLFKIKVEDKYYKLESETTGPQSTKCHELLRRLSGLFEHPEFVKVSLDYKIKQYKNRIESR